MLTVLNCLAFVGCGRMDAYVEVHQSAKSVLHSAVEMEELFGDADHFITHYGAWGRKSNTWNTVVFFGGRYEFTMQVEVSVDYANKQIHQLGQPTFYLWEVSEVEVLPDSRAAAHYSRRDIHVGEKEWKVIFNSGGDFRTANIELLSTQVPQFDDYVAQVRKDRVPISLLPSSAERFDVQVVDGRIVRTDSPLRKK